MSDKSPLFVSALELLAHATELYASGHAKKYKFVILHLANAVELLMKDCLIDNGISIYKNPKETITIWGAFEELNKCKITIPEKPVMELLIDDRNTIQHRFGFPNAEAVFYYLEQVVAFFNRFLDEHYQTTLSEALEPHLSKEHLALIGLVEDNYNHLRKLFQLSPEAAIQQAYALIEGKLRSLVPYSELQAKLGGPKNRVAKVLLPRDGINILINEGHLSPDVLEEFDQLRHIRNQAAHMSIVKVKGTDWDGTLKTAINILGALDKITRKNSAERGAEAGEAS